MKIEHIAIWTKNLETMREFYSKYFNAEAKPKYKNEGNAFESYFLHFENGTRLELMHMPCILSTGNDSLKQHIGIIHIAFSVGSKERVIELTELIENDGYKVAERPRKTGDGFFESTIFDPENNRVEITV